MSKQDLHIFQILNAAWRRSAITSFAPIALFCLIAGCSAGEKKEVASDSADILVTVGDSSLMLQDVQRQIPSGISSEDSTAMFNSLVESWIEQMLLADIAEKNIVDMERIDHLTADYRKKLIISEYRRNVREQTSDKVSQNDLDTYYDSHPEEMVLDSPVVKGLYVKLPSDSERLGDVRRWMMTATPDAIDDLEQYGLREAIEYSFFDNHWMPWSTIAGQVPFRFDNADKFVKSNRDFETSYRGITYLIHISDFLSTGEKMPREVAYPIIRDRLETLYGDRYEQRLIRELYQKAEENGALKLVNYKFSPVKI